MSITSVTVTSQKSSTKKTKTNAVAKDDDLFQKMMNQELIGKDDDRHINTFVEQTLANAPETEKQIWARMKKELGI